MKFKRIKKIAYQANPDRCLVLRQEFAKRALKMLFQGKTFLNIDESFLTETDFRRMIWRSKGTANQLKARQVTPRIAIIAAVSSHNDIYLALH